MAKKYIVDLSETELSELRSLTKTGKRSARTITRAHVLLMVHDGKTDSGIAEALKINVSTVERIREKFVVGGLEFALNHRPHPPKLRKLNGKEEAFLIATACSTPPEGRKGWTMQLLTDQLINLGFVDSISDETVRLILKKRLVLPWLKEQWCIPEVNAEYVLRMEDLLDLYNEPYDPKRPVVCFDVAKLPEGYVHIN